MDNILSTEKSTISSQDLPKYGYIYITTNLINNKKYIERIKASKRRPRTQKEIDHMNYLHSRQVGKHHSEESKIKSRNSNLGQKRSNEARKNMSENHADISGEKNPFYGKHHSEESRKLISKNNAKAHSGKIWITNKIDDEVLIKYEELVKYPNYVRGRLRKSQRNNLGR